MKWYHYILCFTLIFIGIFSSVKLVKLFNISSKEYGTAVTIETKNNYDEISKFDFGSIAFISSDNVNFSNITSFSPQEFNGENKNYFLLFNDQMAINTIVSSGKIAGDINLLFYSVEGENVSKAEMHFIIEYYAGQTKVTVTTKNTNDSIAYLETYMSINGAVLKVVERSAT